MPQQNNLIGSRKRLSHNYLNGSSAVETVTFLLLF